MKSSANRSGILRRFGLWLVFALVTSVLMVVSPTFRSSVNLENILEQNAIIGIVACGMAVMMISGGFDLSVGAVGATASVVGAVVASRGHGAVVTIGAGLLAGIAVGAANGVLIAKVRINAFVATFAMASIVSGLLFVATGAESKQGATSLLESAANARVLGIPVIFAVFICCLLAVWFLLTRTRYGHYIYSVGGNAEASHLSGVPVQRVQIFAFAMGGLLAAGAGLLLLGQTLVGQPSAAADWPLEAIAICVVGGIALTGGVGRIEDVLAATLLLGVISNGLNQLNVSPYWKPTVTGLVILMAVVIDRYSRLHNGAGRRGSRNSPTAAAPGAPTTPLTPSAST
ncbi:ABC transporter permease [Streptomyces sp. NPDC048415]|uniref:ABC transporter permease n=1 Tax=Streptomyces sp. NPDC048415 TaxID=3154822 RepID=UPI0034149EA9